MPDAADESASPNAWAQPSAAAMTTRGQVVLLHDGIEELLVYDRHEQRGALVEFHDLRGRGTLGPAELARLLDDDLGDFADGAHELVGARRRQPDRATLRRHTAAAGADDGAPSRRW